MCRIVQFISFSGRQSKNWGTGKRQYWWEQSFELEEFASEFSGDGDSVVADVEEGVVKVVRWDREGATTKVF